MSDKPHIALLPGLDGSGELFFALAPLLHQHFTVHIVRYSDETRFADYVDSAASQLPDSAPLSLVAESFSGPIAIALLARQPQRFAASVLSATFCKSPLPLLTRWARLMPAALFTSHPASRLCLDLLVSGGDADAELRHKSHELLQTIPAKTFQQRIEIVDAVDVTRELSAVETPLLYLRATQDRIVLQDSGDEIMRHARHIRLEAVDGPHMILQTRAAQCADLIVEHVARHSA